MTSLLDDVDDDDDDDDGWCIVDIKMIVPQTFHWQSK